MKALEQAFLEQLRKNLTTAQLVCGCNPEGFLQRLEQKGVVRSLSQAALRGQLSNSFGDLAKCGRLDLSAEALICQPEYGELFEHDVVNACLDALCEAGYFQIG